MLQFSDLKLGTQHTMLHSIQAVQMFENGYGVSVIRSNFSYGGKNGFYEIAVLNTNGDLCYDTPITDDVIGWLDETGVSDVMHQVQELPIKETN